MAGLRGAVSHLREINWEQRKEVASSGLCPTRLAIERNYVPSQWATIATSNGVKSSLVNDRGLGCGMICTTP